MKHETEDYYIVAPDPFGRALPTTLRLNNLLYSRQMMLLQCNVSMVINDQTDNVYYALPSLRENPRRQEHNLQKDISLIRSSARKTLNFVCISSSVV